MSSFNCEKCGTPIIDTEDGYKTECEHYAPDLAYDERHDAWYVIKTGRWTESKCSDPNCDHCKDRPETANAEVSGAGTASAGMTGYADFTGEENVPRPYRYSPGT